MTRFVRPIDDLPPERQVNALELWRLLRQLFLASGGTRPWFFNPRHDAHYQVFADLAAAGLVRLYVDAEGFHLALPAEAAPPCGSRELRLTLAKER